MDKEKEQAISNAIEAMINAPYDVTEAKRAEEIQQQAAEIRARVRPEGRYSIEDAVILLRAETGDYYPLVKAVESGDIPCYKHEAGDKKGDPQDLRSYVCWDDLNKWIEEKTDIRKFRFTKKVKAAPVITPSGDDWITKARAFADKLALERYQRGEREITARNISDAVASELAKDSKTHGIRGERSAGNIRNEALKGWKFIPPTGTNGTSGTKK